MDRTENQGSDGLHDLISSLDAGVVIVVCGALDDELM